MGTLWKRMLALALAGVLTIGCFAGCEEAPAGGGG